MLFSEFARISLLSCAFLALVESTPPPKPAVDQLQFVDWMWSEMLTPDQRSKAGYPPPTQREISDRLVVDAQALLLRGSILSLRAEAESDPGFAEIASHAAADCERIAAARPSEQYIPSHALARTDLTLSWLPDAEQAADERQLAHYLVAFMAIAREAEEGMINPDGLVPFLNSSPSSDRSSPPHYTPPANTYEARNMVRRDLASLLTAVKVSPKDLDGLAAAFADQSLGGVKYILELRDKLVKDTAP